MKAAPARWAVASSEGGRRPKLVCAPLTAGEAQAFIAGYAARGWYVVPLPPGYRRGDITRGLSQ
jgi:hypothetical protein